MTLSAIVQQIYSCFGQGDVPGILVHLDDNVQWEQWADNLAQKADVPWMRHRKGKNEVVGFFQDISELTQITDFQVLNLMEGGNQVAAELLIEANIPSTGGHFRDEEMHLWTFNPAGKVIRLRHYTDTHKHILAAKR